MKKKPVFCLLALICLVAMGFGLFQHGSSKPAAMDRVRRDRGELEALARAVLTSGGVAGVSYRGYQIEFWPEAQMVEFLGKARGLGSAASYEGFYYSANAEPRSFQGAALPLTADGPGWRWEAEGDNWGYTERITDGWYWFEAHF